MFAEEIQKVPLWHQRKEAALRSEIRHITEKGRFPTDDGADFSDFLMGAFQKFAEQTQFMHGLKSRRMNGVTAEVSQEIGVLLQDQDFDSRPRQEVSEHHPGGASASDTTAALQFLR
jgi:hypothetical protein